jgi:two-component system, LytTR family, response regulator
MEKMSKWQINPTVLQKTLYFQSDRGYSLMVLRNRKQEVLDMPLNELEKLVPPEQFYRVHRSYLVNISAISEFRYYRNQLLAIVQEYRIPVSRRRRRMLMDNLEIL